MRQSVKALLLAGTVLLCASWQSTFAGVGVYLQAEPSSDVDWTLSYPGDDDIERAGSISTTGVGFVLDTSPSDKRVFNYRLNVGYERLEGKLITHDSGSKFNLNGLMLDNTFGFAVFRGKVARVWLGPQVKFGAYAGTDKYDYDIALVRFGVGIVAGANFQVARHFNISGTLGLSISGFAGTASPPAEIANESDTDFTGSSKIAPSVNVSFLF